MRYCKNCGVGLLHNQNKICPLCQSVLQREEEVEENQKQKLIRVVSAGYPPAQATKKKYAILLRICMFVGFLAMVTLAAINYVTYASKPIMWALISDVGILYLLFTLRYCVFNGDESIVMKIATQSILVMGLCVLIDYVVGFSGWSFVYAMPSIILVGDALVMLLMLIDLQNWHHYILLQLLMAVLSILPILLAIPNIVKGTLLSLIAAGVSIALFLGAWIIGGKKADTELKRRFHV